MRDHTKLKAFELADALVVRVYQGTASFPQTEQYGLTSQIRKSTLSIPSNIVEGCARSTEKEYLRFLDMAYGSARELEYQLSLAARLGYLTQEQHQNLASSTIETSKVLSGLIRALRR